jgi:cytochrome c oxidase subunit 2
MNPHSVIDPHSPQARAVAHLWWWMLGAGGVVWLLVIVAMVLAIKRRRATRREVSARAFALFIATTGVVLASFLAYDFAVGRELADRRAPALTIDVTGHQWWWEIAYQDSSPADRVITANEVHVPVGQLVQFRLRAADVIHSFWAPNLNGKRDLVPGYDNALWFLADTAGVYRGQCAEFCGRQHAKMAFYVIAQTPAAFAAWRSATARPHGPPPDSIAAQGARVFFSSGCAACHAIAGTAARGTKGPTLTHLASRGTIAAGTLPNSRANLTAWVIDPSALKPGALMPSIPLYGDELQALIAYLESLR